MSSAPTTTLPWRPVAPEMEPTRKRAGVPRRGRSPSAPALQPCPTMSATAWHSVERQRRPLWLAASRACVCHGRRELDGDRAERGSCSREAHGIDVLLAVALATFITQVESHSRGDGGGATEERG